MIHVPERLPLGRDKPKVIFEQRTPAGAVRAVGGFTTDPIETPAGSPVARAFHFASRNADQFDPRLEEVLGESQDVGRMDYRPSTPRGLLPDLEQETVRLHSVRFGQYVGGRRVLDSGLSVNLTPRGEAVGVAIDIAEPSVEQVVKPMPQKHAVQIALRYASATEGSLGRRPHLERVAFPAADGLREAWRVGLCIRPSRMSRRPAASWLVVVDEESGEVLDGRDLLSRETGLGRVFYPNPVAFLGRWPRTWSELRSAYRDVELEGLQPGSTLDGEYVTTRLTRRRARRRDRRYIYRMGRLGFGETMAYYWIHRAASAVEGILMPAERLKRFRVDARGSASDQSFFDPQNDEINFGLGGIDDAEDADIILHEFAHALLDRMVPGWGDARVGTHVLAMGEGFADFFSACFLSRFSEHGHEMVGEWDAGPWRRGLRQIGAGQDDLSLVGEGRIASLGYDTMTCERHGGGSPEWKPGTLVDNYVIPDVEPRYGLPELLRIKANDGETLTLDLGRGPRLKSRTAPGRRFAGEPHREGLAWSGVLWQVYRELIRRESERDDPGRALERASDSALRLSLEAHTAMNDADRNEIDFRRGASRLLTVAGLFDPGVLEAVRTVLRQHGLEVH